LTFVIQNRGAKLPSYVSVQRDVPRFWITNVNVNAIELVDDARVAVYLVIKSGGKWGYDDAFQRFLTELAPFLAYDRSWSITPRRDNAAPMISKAVELMKLERYVEADACLVKAMSLATTRRVIGTIYYNRACIAARTDDTQRAITTLAFAIELVPDYKAMAKEDDDFASLRDLPGLQRILS